MFDLSHLETGHPGRVVKHYACIKWGDKWFEDTKDTWIF
jgi:hypothetical protein